MELYAEMMVAVAHAACARLGRNVSLESVSTRVYRVVLERPVVMMDAAAHVVSARWAKAV